MNQAYRIGDRTWGVQFHFEIDRAEIEFWLESFESTENLERTWGKWTMRFAPRRMVPRRP